MMTQLSYVISVNFLYCLHGSVHEIFWTFYYRPGNSNRPLLVQVVNVNVTLQLHHDFKVYGDILKCYCHIIYFVYCISLILY